MTLAEVAKRAQVSTATVSRVLNNPSLVREATRQRVLKAAQELKYHPNLHAQTLAGGRSKTIGMIVSNIENPFFLDIFCSLEGTAAENGYEVVVQNTDYRPSRLVACVRSMLGHRLAGLAVIVSEMDPDVIQELTEQDLRIVFYDVGKPARNITKIRVRYGKGMRRTVEYLYSVGHRRMAFVGHHGTLGPLHERRRTFLRTLAQFPDVEHATASNLDSPAGGRLAARQLLSSGFEPTAVICVNDYMAIGVMRELRDQGFQIPRDVSVTGFDNIELSAFVHPALTTANIPRHRIGEMAFEALVPTDRPGLKQGREILIEPELVLRESSGPAPK